jgi:uncharacterized integral membrane protein
MERTILVIEVVDIISGDSVNSNTIESAAFTVLQHFIVIMFSWHHGRHNQDRMLLYNMHKGLLIIMIIMVVCNQDEVGRSLALKRADIAIGIKIPILAIYGEMYGGVAEEFNLKLAQRCVVALHNGSFYL